MNREERGPAPTMTLTGRSRLADVANGLRSGERDLLGFLAEVCDRLDGVEGQVEALLPEPERRARVLEAGRTLLSRWPDVAQRPSLFGVPIVVKDAFAVDGLPTRAGTRLPAAIFKMPQAAAVTRLVEAGAIVLGKGAMDEFGYCEPPTTHNPLDLEHTPGGSSGGSAAAVAAAYGPLALGSQTSRDVIGPAAFCGLVGFKPSYARVPVTGLVPLAPSLDTVGILTQDVAGARLAASILCAPWKADRPSVERPVMAVPQGRFLSWVEDEALAHFQATVARLRKAGYTVHEVAWMSDDDLEQVYENALKLMVGEMAEVHNAWFALYENQYRERTALAIRQGQKVPADEVLTARAGQMLLRSMLETFMQGKGIDLWLTPSSRGTAPRGLALSGWGGMTTPWSYAGLPALGLPSGTASNGLPLGVQLVGRYGRDEDVLQWADGVVAAI